MKTSRRDIRVIIIQVLFEVDFNEIDPNKDLYIEIFNRIAKEKNPELINDSFAKDIIGGIVSKYEEINGIIEQTSLHWTLDKIGSIDRNILRLGVYEILYGKELSIPGKVAVNEAIEIAKLFLNEPGKKFISGILGTIYNEVKDPNEEETHKKSIIKKSVGAVVYRIDEKTNTPMFAFIFDVFGKWTLSKSSLNKNEDLNSGIKRVIEEELGLEIIPIEKIGENEYSTHPPEGCVKKKVTYFLVKTKDIEIKLKISGGLIKAKWFSFEDAKKLSFYVDMKEIIFYGMSEANKKYEK